MKYRKLRIAWSAACGFVCLMLIDIWVNAGSDRVLLNFWDHWTTIAVVASLAVVPWWIR